MPTVSSLALEESIEVDRLIGKIEGSVPGPCLVFFAGIHGNEPAGIFALRHIFEEIEARSLDIKGTLIGISGNLWALKRSERFQKNDLNRLWTEEHVEALENDNFEPKNEDERQQKEIFNELRKITDTHEGPYYFFDLHTTSSETKPFITVNDSLLNRKYTQQYPIPKILGIEEFLDGPLLSYLNELGYVSFGFEAGQHDTLASVENHRIFILLSLLFTGSANERDFPFNDYLKNWIEISSEHQDFYEIYFQHKIQTGDSFAMEPGYSNFSAIRKGVSIAQYNGTAIVAKKQAILFMPLYQAKGNDGYFLIKKISGFFLALSAILRQLQIDRIFPLLPGVRWSSEKKEAMIVNLSIARFIARPFFHLFGYRSRQLDKNHLLIKNREYGAKKHDYRNEKWYH